MAKDIFELTFEKAAIGMAHVDANGKWLRANPQLCRFLGYNANELYQLTFQEITHPDDLQYDLKHAHQLLQGDIDSFTIEKRYIRKDGNITWAQLTASCVRNTEGQIEYFISVINDINERKKLESNLKKVEAAFNTTGDGLYWIDLNANIIHVNDAACNMLGYTYNELTAMRIPSLDPHVDEIRWMDIIHQLKSDNFITLESLHINKNGMLKEVGITGNYFNIDNHEYIFATVRDLTHTKIILRELEESNKKYKESNDNLRRAEKLAQLGHWSLDIRTNELYWSDEIFTIFDIDQKIFGATYEAFLETIHPEDREMVNQAYCRSLESKEKYQIVHRLLLSNGTIKYVMEQCETLFDDQGTPLISTGTVQDITKSYQTHQLLLESELFYRTIVSSIDDAIFILEDNIIVDCNPSSAYLFEITRSGLIGTDIRNLTGCILETSEEPFPQCLINAYQGHITHLQCTLIFNREGKKNKLLEMTLANYGNEKNKLIILARDITKKIEEEKLYKMHTRQAQMGEMISMIAHQWRQPLAIINALASQIRIKELLKDDENPELIAQLSKIEQQSLYLSQTISDYRDFFRPDKPVETISLSELVDHALELIDHTIKSKAVTVRQCIHHNAIIDIYRNELIQVIVSLFKNSFDAFDENKIGNRIIQIDIDHDEKYGLLSITDNGGGITPEVLEKVFTPYFTTKNHSDGTGLGLYMSKMIIEEHCGGIMEVSSIANETLITLKLPIGNPI